MGCTNFNLGCLWSMVVCRQVGWKETTNGFWVFWVKMGILKCSIVLCFDGISWKVVIFGMKYELRIFKCIYTVLCDDGLFEELWEYVYICFGLDNVGFIFCIEYAIMNFEISVIVLITNEIFVLWYTLVGSFRS